MLISNKQKKIYDNFKFCAILYLRENIFSFLFLCSHNERLIKQQLNELLYCTPLIYENPSTCKGYNQNYDELDPSSLANEVK